jgi:hypothetical protein
MNNFIPLPAFASGIDPPSYVILCPLSPAKTVSGIARQRTMASNLFIEKLPLAVKSGAQVYICLVFFQQQGPGCSERQRPARGEPKQAGGKLKRVRGRRPQARDPDCSLNPYSPKAG